MRGVLAARRVLEQLMITQPPVPLHDILKSRGIYLIEMKMDSIDAIFLRLDKKEFIAVKRAAPLARKRFSIAHEIGHAVLGHKPLVLSAVGSQLHGDEREADEFAAELLMPRAMLAREWFHFTPSELATRYGVSLQAMEIRLAELGFLSREGIL